ncbi:hypothetical protein GCM10023319_19760 [Nocardia iowensis]
MVRHGKGDGACAVIGRCGPAWPQQLVLDEARDAAEELGLVHQANILSMVMKSGEDGIAATNSVEMRSLNWHRDELLPGEN